MKKLIAILIAIVLVATIGGGVVWAQSSSNNGVPAQKMSVGSATVDYTPAEPSGTTNKWYTDTDLCGTGSGIAIHTPNNQASTLIISYTGETAIATDVQIKGTNSKQISTSWGGIKVRALVDGTVVAQPGDVTLNSRLMTLTGLLWPETTVGLTTLDQQYIDIYEQTKSANGFNFIVPNVGGGTHYVQIQYSIDWGQTTTAINQASAVVGKRTCIIEVDNIN